ncbi:hypothetical protein J2S44_005657 [Catenuloplanes niger]|uniref:Uncharacterized protein n=1 Tax=Catenuloplanes niger TaxID=587534 RepID=A0AAE4CVG6_9ACTN|nr:hypothetical protein [Catenuloplanes niger]MDR7325407.1 hypothetical protein [Catenuloplanes niger]
MVFISASCRSDISFPLSSAAKNRARSRWSETTAPAAPAQVSDQPVASM